MRYIKALYVETPESWGGNEDVLRVSVYDGETFLTIGKLADGYKDDTFTGASDPFVVNTEQLLLAINLLRTSEEITGD